MRNDLFKEYIDKMNSVRPIIVFISMRIYRVLIYICITYIYVYTYILDWRQWKTKIKLRILDLNNRVLILKYLLKMIHTYVKQNKAG